MNNKIRNALIGVVGASCLLAQGVSALGNNGCGCSRLRLFGEAIYVKPTCGGVNWAVSDTLDPANGTLEVTFAVTAEPPITISDGPSGAVNRRSLCPDYEWGFRIGGVYEPQNGCNYAQLSGRYVQFREHARLRGNVAPLLPVSFDGSVTLTTEGFQQNLPLNYNQLSFLFTDAVARGNLKTDYWDIDARFGQYLYRDCGRDFHLFGGVRYVNICEQVNAHIAGGSLIEFSAQQGIPIVEIQILDRSMAQSQKREFSGAGPEIGIGGKLDVWCDLYLRGELMALAAIGARKGCATARVDETIKASITGTLEPPISPVTANIPYRQRFCYDSYTLVVPGFDTRLAVGYVRKCGCLDGSIEVGYALTHYWCVFGDTTGASSNVSASNGTLPRDFGIAGPYIGLKLTY